MSGSYSIPYPLLKTIRQLGLSDFESLNDCQLRQTEMLDRLEQKGYDALGRDFVTECSRDYCAADYCSEGCHFATRFRRIYGIYSAYKIFANHPGPFFDVSLVHPRWEKIPGTLETLNIAAARQWNYRRLRSLDATHVIAIGMFEVSLNRELDGSTHWGGEIHQVVAGAEKKDLSNAFKIEKRYREQRPSARLLVVTEAENLIRRIAYSQKRFVEERRAYISASTSRQARRHLPPKAADWAEHDAWLLGLPLGARTIAFGCARRGYGFLARE
jgi:hypothetical protein